MDEQELALPTDSYKLRIVEAEFGESKKSGDPYIKTTSEIFDAAPLDIGGKTVDPNGLKIQCWHMFGDDYAQYPTSAQALANGLGIEDEATPENLTPDIIKGAVFAAVCRAKKQERKNAAGATMTHPVTGETIYRYSREIEQILNKG